MKRIFSVLISTLAVSLLSSTVVKAVDPAPPGAVSQITQVSKNATSLTVSWNAPSDTGMLPIDDYIIQFKTSNGSWSSFQDGVSASTSATITGLVRGSTYFVRIAAVNALGQGPYLELQQGLIPAVAPSAPTNVQVQGTFSSSQYSSVSRTISWTMPDDGGRPILDYEIQFSSDGETWSTFADGVSSGTTATVTGLTRDLFYGFRIRTKTDEGFSSYSNQPWFKHVDAAESYACANSFDGRVFCWGDGTQGQIGRGPNYWSVSALEIPGLSDIAEISSGTSHACGLRQTGQVMCWGSNSGGRYISGGSATYSGPVLAAVSGVRSVSSGHTATCVIKDDNTVACIGTLNGSTTYRYLDWTQITGVDDAGASIAVGYGHVCVATTSSGVKCWGNNDSGQLGNGTNTPSASAVLVSGLSGVTDLSVSVSDSFGGSCSVLQDGTLKCWGSNAGSRFIGQSPWTPTTVSVGVPLRTVDFHYRTVCGVSLQSVPYCWGSNSYSSVGSNSFRYSESGGVVNGTLDPKIASVTTSVRNVSAGVQFGCAVTTAGAIWCWGRDSSGQVGFTSSTGVNGARPRALDIGYVASSQIISTVPSSPSQVSETSHSENSVQISWNAPNDDGGATISDYAIQYFNGSSWIDFNDAVSTLTSATVTGLPRGVSYQFRVAAVNSLGQGAFSATSSSSIPAVVPRAPLSLKFARWTGGFRTASADLSWTSPDNGGQSVTDFNVEYRVSGSQTWSTFNDGISSNSYVSVTGLTRSVNYEFRVRAINAEGAGPWTYSSTEFISAGGSQACVVQVDGQTKCWGANASGQLGDGTTLSKSSPVTMAGTSRGVANTVGQSHSCVLTALDLVYCVGSNSSGQLGDGTGVQSSSLVQVSGISGVSKIAAGGSTSCSIVVGGAVKCWGANSSGQLGNGSTNDSLVPVSVTGVSGATSIAVGTSHSCAIVASGAVQCWGNNASGQLGNGTTTDSATAVSVSGLSGAISISAGGSSTCAVLSSGAVRCWGSNASRQLGNGSANSSSVPVAVTGISSAVKVVSGSSHNCALLADSRVQCWGNNVSGQLGNGTTTNQDVPAFATGVSNAIDIATGSLFTCVTKSVGGVDCWGAGGSGQLGDGLNSSSNSSVTVTGISIVSVLVPVTGPSAPLSLTEVSHSDTQVVLNWTAPSDNGGSPVTDYKIEYKPAGGSWAVFGDGVSTSTSVTITGLTRGTKYTFRVTGVNAIEDGDISLVSVEITPSVVPGEIRSLQLLTFSNSSISVSWLVPLDDGGSPVTDYKIEYKPAGGSWTIFNDGVSTSTLGVISGLQQGTLYSVRVSAVNANGSGSSLALSSDVRPATVPGLVSGLRVDSYSSSAIQISWTAGTDGGESITDYIIEYSTGTVWTVLSDGVSTSTSATISGIGVGQLVRVRVKAQNSVGIGFHASLFDEGLSGFDMSGHTCAVGASGSVWCSGQNSSGQLGDGTISAHYQFSRVPSISGATKVATGWDHTCAIVALGAVKCWGANATGQLGDGTTTTSRRAVAVLGVSGAIEISAGRGFTCIVLNSGAAKCWGDNSQKQLGNNSSATFSTTAVDVTGIATANKVAAAQYTACVILSDTTVKCWGDNRYGQVSNGGTVSPITTPSTARFGASSNLLDVTSISSDPFADVFCAVTATTRGWCWGTNGVYQRGNNTTTANPYMTSPNGLTTGVQSIAVGGGHACASVTGDVIKCWGYNVQGGASGGASRTNVPIPTTVSGASGSNVLLGIYSSCSYTTATNWQCWGLNSSFERGDGGPDGGGPYSVEVSRQALLVVDRPSAPSSLQVTAYSTSSISLSWAEPTSNGGVPLYDYVIEVKESTNSWALINDGVGTSRVFTWNSATKGSSYLFRVSATNISEISSDATTTSNSVIARVVPGSPTLVRETGHTDASLTFGWTAPSDDGGSPITDYKVEVQVAGGNWSVFNDGVSTSTSAVVTGLTRGSRYAVRVSAVSDEGASVPGLSEKFSSLSLGRHSCAVIAGGEIACWGNNTFGQIGVPPTTPIYQQVLVPGISSATKVEVGTDHTCALLANQTVKCWGAGALGQLGNGSNAASFTPVTVSGLSGVTDLSSGNEFTCAVKNDGTVWCWGRNDYWQVNNANSTNSNVPVSVQGLNGATVVESGDFFACAIITNGQISCWGRSTDGRLGNNTGGVVKFSGSGTALTGATSLSLNSSNSKACAVSIGSLRCWGSGFGNTAVYVTNLINKATIVSVGTQHVCATSNGGVACWGDNNPGALGSGNRTSISDWTVTQASPPANSPYYSIASNSGIVSVYSGHGVTCANSTVQMYCWGDNDFGQMARPISSDVTDDWLSPTPVSSGRWSVPTGRAAAVTELTETHSRTSVTVGWLAPADTGGYPIHDYQIQYRRQSDSTWTTFDDGLSSSPSSSVTGLSNGQQYSFRIAPITADGVGQFSSEISAYAAGNPTGVLNLDSPSHTTTSFDLSWSAPADDGGRAITDYIIEYKVANSSTWLVLNDGVSAGTTASISGLTRGTEYNVRVTARSANGDGTVTQMAGVVIPATVPAALSAVSVSAPTTGGALSVAYAVGDNGGRAIQAIWYRIDSGVWVNAACCSSPLQISGLTNGTSYSIEVKVSNGDGFSPTTSGLTATPSATPSAPTITSITRPVGGSQLSVAFTGGADNGAAISGYEFSVNGGVTWFGRTDGGGTSSPLVISSLVNGTTYQLRLRAVNIQGSGVASTALSAIPATTPGAPTITRLEPADGQLAIVIGAPVNNGGASVSNYEYSLDGGVNWITRSPASVVSPWSITGLSNGTVYSIMLRAINVQGIGVSSASVSGTPASLPSAPTISSISRPVAGQSLEVAFLAPLSNGGAPLTTYQYSLNAGLTWTTRSDSQTVSSPLRISGLVNGNTYQVAIRALNAQGAGIGSSVVAETPAGVPTAPNISFITSPVSGEQLDISFVAAGANGAEVSTYQLSLDGGTTWVDRSDGLTTESPISVGALVNGQAYNVRVRGVNSQGQGIASTSLVATPATRPDAPVIASLAAGESSFRITVRVTNTGGSAITSYAYSIDAGSTWTSWTASSGASKTVPATVGMSYSVIARVANRQGNSPASDVSVIRVGDPPDAQTTGASDVTSTTAVLAGRVTANFALTEVSMQVSTQSDFSSDVQTFPAGNVSGVSSSAVSLKVVDLQESTVYFYRVLASNALGRTVGATVSFETSAPVGVSIEDGADYTDSPRVLVNLSWPRAAMAVLLSNDGGFRNYKRISLSKTTTWTLASTGSERLPKTIYVRYVMSDGSRSETFTDDIILDETDPTVGQVSVRRVAETSVNALSLWSAKLPSVRMTVSASDSNSGLDRIEVKSGRKSVRYSVAPRSKKVSIVLTTQKRTVQIRSVDRAGNTSKWKTVKLP
jgi:alpha-tubulin suppressor-like RCC1 family protein/predicted RNA-binding protein with TRAM domain